jgi:hypothetical protein
MAHLQSGPHRGLSCWGGERSRIHRGAARSSYIWFGLCVDPVSNVVSGRRRDFRCESATAMPAASKWKFPRIQTSGGASAAGCSRHCVNASEGLHRLHVSSRRTWGVPQAHPRRYPVFSRWARFRPRLAWSLWCRHRNYAAVLGYCPCPSASAVSRREYPCRGVFARKTVWRTRIVPA